MHRHKMMMLALALGSASVLPAQGPAAGTSVTLFNSGRVLVRRTFTLPIGSGLSRSMLPIGEFTAGTFDVLEPGVRLVSIESDAGTSEDVLLRRHVGESFDIDTSGRALAPTRRATLLAVDPERWQWNDRPGVLFGRPGRIVWSRDLVPVTQTAEVTLNSDRARSSLRTMYETEGSAWGATYQLYLGGAGHFDGTALINSGTLSLADVEVQLLSGDIGRGAPPQPVASKSYAMAAPMAMRAEADVTGSATSESVGETHLYTIPGRVTFAPGTNLVIALFDPAPVHADRRYVLPGALPFYGGYGQDQEERPTPVAVQYHVDRKLGTAFGEIALPPGYVAIYDNDKGGRVQLVGQGYISHTAAGSQLLVDAGTAFDVTAHRVQTSYATSRTPNAPTRTVATAAYRVTIANARDSAVVVEVREDRGGEWSVTESSLPALKRSATRTVFSVPVAPRDSTVLTYSVRVVW